MPSGTGQGGRGAASDAKQTATVVAESRSKETEVLLLERRGLVKAENQSNQSG
jgi:hypothetical protein